MRMLHLSKELHAVPRYALGVDGKPTDKVVGYTWVIHRGDGNTYVRNPPKAPSRRDLHRARRTR